MAIDFKTISADTTFGSGAFLFGADSQSASEPSLYSESTVFGYLLGLANTWTNSQTINTGVKTASAPILDMSQTWNNGAITFTGIKANITDTSSAAGSLLMDLQVGGASKFKVSKGGSLTIPAGESVGSPLNSGVAFSSNNSVIFRYLSTSIAGIAYAGGLMVSSSQGFTWGNVYTASGDDLFLTRKAAASLRLGAADAASPVAQTFGVQSVVAGTTNTAGANFTIAGSQGTGTGTGGSIVFQVAPAGSSGTAQNALATALTIASTTDVTFAANAIITGKFFTNTSLTGNDYFLGANFYAGLNVRLASGVPLGWSSSATSPNSAADLTLFRDAANTLALRNGTNAQTFRVYNTYTDASNYERGVFDWGTTSNTLTIGTQNAGSGSIRNLQFVVAGTNRLDYGVTNAGIWTASAGFQALYFQVPNTSGYIWTSRSQIKSPADGVITLLNSGGSDFGRLQFGGTTSSFPALKRSSDSLHVVKADDSGLTDIVAKNILNPFLLLGV